MVRPFRLDAISSLGWSATIDAVRAAVASAGGEVVDFHEFGNKLISFDVESVPPAALAAMLEGLSREGVRLSRTSDARLAEEGAPPSGALRLSVQLVNDEPDGRSLVPPIPG